ncbi:MAG: hypothetical protein ACRC8O_04530 [Plesiomonas shigelloides]
MLAFSGDFSLLKMSLLFLIVGYCSIHAFLDGYSINKNVVLYIFIWTAVFLASYIYGLYYGFLFSFPLFFYFIITPFLAYLISAKLTINFVFYLNNVIFYSTAFVVILNLYYIGYRLGFYQMPETLSSLSTFGGVKLGDEQLEVRTTSQASLIFLLPYLFTIYFHDRSFFVGRLYQFFAALVLLMSFVVVIFSGRRSLQIIIFIGIFINYFLYVLKWGWSRRIFKSLIMFLVVFLCSFLLIALVSDISNPIDTFFNTIALAFDSSEGGGIARSIQSKALIDYLASAPLFGHGLNSHPLYIRNSTDPWSYEWVYLALLGQVGVVIFLFFIISLFIVFYRNISLFLHLEFKCSVFFGAISNGFVCFVIAGSSNPMIYFIWFWVLSLICFNPCFKNVKRSV